MTDFPLITRWTPNAKRRFVERAERGDFSLTDALKHYRISEDEYARWREDYAARAKESVR